MSKLREIRARVEVGDVSTLDNITLSLLGELELRIVVNKPYFPLAIIPTTYIAKNRLKYNLYVRDCEDVFVRTPSHF